MPRIPLNSLNAVANSKLDKSWRATLISVLDLEISLIPPAYFENNKESNEPDKDKKPKKQNETSKPGHEDLPNPDKYFELVKFKIVDPKKSPKKQKEQPLNEVRYSQFKSQSKNRSDKSNNFFKK